MSQKTVLRLGAVALVLGAALALVFNLLYPRGDDLSAVGFVELAAETARWPLVHYMIAWAVALLFVGVLILTRSLTSQASMLWGRLAAYSVTGSSALMLATLMLSGSALPAAVDAGASPAALEALGYVSNGMFVASIGAYFGLTPVLLGIAVLTGRDHPAWLGWVVAGAGVLGLVTGSIMFFQAEPTALTANVLFPIASVVMTLWAGAMGVRLWQRTAAMAAPEPDQPAAGV